MQKTIDITGQKFGKLTAIEFLYKTNSRHYWKFQCECGNERIVSKHIVKIGRRKSCGCSKYNKEGQPMNTLTPGESSLNAFFASYKKRSKKANRDFKLTQLEFNILVKQNCHYCNAIPRKFKAMKSYNGECFVNGIDRKNNNEGYILENSVPCCKICNYAKKSMPQEEFYDWIKKVYVHSFGDK